MQGYITYQQRFKGHNLHIIKKILIIIIAAGILAALFAVGIVFFVIALIMLPIVYLYQKYKMDNLWGKVAEAKKAQAENEDKIIHTEGATVIDAEFEEVTKDKE